MRESEKGRVQQQRKDVGEVTALKRDASGKVAELQAGIGGFIGIGETQVRVMPTQFKLQNDRVVLSLTAEQVKTLPKIVNDAISPAAASSAAACPEQVLFRSIYVMREVHEKIPMRQARVRIVRRVPTISPDDGLGGRTFAFARNGRRTGRQSDCSFDSHQHSRTFRQRTADVHRTQRADDQRSPANSPSPTIRARCAAHPARDHSQAATNTSPRTAESASLPADRRSRTVDGARSDRFFAWKNCSKGDRGNCATFAVADHNFAVNS